MTAPNRDPLDICRTMLAASTSAETEIAFVYVGRARLALEEAREAIRVLELQVIARERELARVAPAQQSLLTGEPRRPKHREAKWTGTEEVPK